MLHLYYQDFLGVHLPGSSKRCSSRKDATSDSQEHLAALDRLAAQRDSSAVDQIREAFAFSEKCQHCRLVGEVRDFGEWRAKSLKELAMHSSVINCWVHILAAPFDWKSVRYDPCLCPLAFGYWGIRWQPANVEATCLLLAQSFAVGVDVHLRLSNSCSLIPCHSFLLNDFIRLYKRGTWPQDSQSQLLKEGRKVVLQLNYKFYSLEILQFVFYSAYGHVLNFSTEDLTSQTFSLLKSVVQHFTGEPNSICRHLVDIPGLLTNLIVLLDRLVRRIAISDAALCRLVPDLVALFRVNRLFNELQQKLFSRLYSEVKACLENDCVDGSSKLRGLHQPDHCQNGDCIFLDLAVNLFKQLVLRSNQAEECTATLEACLQAYLSDLVDLYDFNRSKAMIRACRDLRCISGILCLVGRPCSDRVSSFQSFLIHVFHTLLLLACDQIVLNFSEVLWIHNVKFSKRIAFQSQLSLVKHHNMPANTFWNPVSTASKGRGMELVPMHFRFTVWFAQTIIRLTKNLENADSTESGELDPVMLQSFHTQLSNPEVTVVFAYPNQMQNVQQLQQEVSKVSARDMRSIAYASYSTVRMPRMRLVVQMVALLQDSSSQQDVKKLLASEVSQASEGRQILCTEEAIKRLVRELNPVQFYARLQHNAELWNRLKAYDESSNCIFDANVQKSKQQNQKQQQHQPACPDHGSYHQACLLWAWFRSVVAAVAVLRYSSCVFASPDAFRGCVERFIVDHSDFFVEHATELLDNGEMEQSHHDLLADVLARTRKRQTRGLSRLPPPPGANALEDAGASAAAAVAAAAATAAAGVSFELKLLPSLLFLFVPYDGDRQSA